MHKRERQYVEFLTKKKIEWLYLPGVKFFRLGEIKYTPDFYLPKRRVYIEVVGSRQSYHQNKHKYQEFKKRFPSLKLVLVCPDGSKYQTWKSTFDMSKVIKTQIKDGRCPRCETRTLRYRKSSDTFWCITCGKDFQKKP